MDETERRLLLALQTDFPLVARPYAELARRFGMDEAACLACLRRFKADGTIRRLGAVFDSRRLGFASTLLAMRVAEPDLEPVIASVNACPHVTHNYVRTGLYNLWAALVAPSPSALAQSVAMLCADRRLVAWLDLPATRVYKVRAVFGDMPSSDEASSSAAVRPLDAADRALVARLQGDILDAGASPFDAADLVRIAELCRTGVIRRIGALLDHRRLGYVANALTAWCVSPSALDCVGSRFAALPWVSHCYARVPRPDWPYTLYAMLHAHDATERAARLDAMAALAASAVDAPVPHASFATLRLCKKASPDLGLKA